MQSNYRHHYLLPTGPSTAAASQLSSSTSSSSSIPLSSSPNKLRQQQQHQVMASGYNNGLPASSSNGRVQQSQILPNNYSLVPKQHHHQHHHQQQQQQQVAAQEFPAAEQLIRYSNRHFIDQQQQFQQQHHQHQQQLLHHQMKAATSRGEYCSNLEGGGSSIDMANQRPKQPDYGNNNNNQAPLLAKQRDFLHQQYDHNKHDDYEPLNNGLQHQHQHQNKHQHHLQDNYTSQIRNSQLQNRFQQQQKHQTTPNSHFSPARAAPSGPMQHQTARSLAGPSNRSVQPNRAKSPSCSSASSSPAGSGLASQVKSAQGKSPAVPKEEKPLHVNFNRSNQASGADEEEGDSRKKKYLTAKYGQQQMNLIKKRLKIEMWLYEQLQELAKGSKSEAELDEIDIDLDQLLDMEDDDTRRRWLKKTLRPFEDLPGEKIDKFINEVMEQSKLL